jgi:hypothetical protein
MLIYLCNEMKPEEFIQDDFLKELFRGQPLDVPGEDFTGKVMEQIVPVNEAVPVKRGFLKIFASSWAYILLFTITLIFVLTSDLPFTNYIPVKEYFSKYLIPQLGSFFSVLKPWFTNSTAISIPLMAVVAGGLLMGLDYFIFRKPRVKHQPAR